MHLQAHTDDAQLRTKISSSIDQPIYSWRSKAREGDKKATQMRGFSTERRVRLQAHTG